MKKCIVYLFCITLSMTIYGMERESNGFDQRVGKKYPNEDQAKQIMAYITKDQLEGLKTFQANNQISFNFFYGDNTHTPLLYAVQHGKKDFINYLIGQKTSVTEQYVERLPSDSLVQYAIIATELVKSGKPEIAPKTFDEIKKSNILLQSPSPLHAAAYGNSGTFPETTVLELVKTLLAARANPDSKMYGGKALHWKYSPAKPSYLAFCYGYLEVNTLLRKCETTTLKTKVDLDMFAFLEGKFISEIDRIYKRNGETVKVKKGYLAELIHKWAQDNEQVLKEYQQPSDADGHQVTNLSGLNALFTKNIMPFAEQNFPETVLEDIKSTPSIMMSKKIGRIYRQCFPSQETIALAKAEAQQYKLEKTEK